MGIKTTVAGLTYAANHTTAAAAAGHNVPSTNAEILQMATEMIIKLNRLKATMQGGDPNITTINTQITALS